MLKAEAFFEKMFRRRLARVLQGQPKWIHAIRGYHDPEGTENALLAAAWYVHHCKVKGAELRLEGTKPYAVAKMVWNRNYPIIVALGSQGVFHVVRHYMGSTLGTNDTRMNYLAEIVQAVLPKKASALNDAVLDACKAAFTNKTQVRKMRGRIQETADRIKAQQRKSLYKTFIQRIQSGWTMEEIQDLLKEAQVATLMEN
jgi:hypothetical protein